MAKGEKVWPRDAASRAYSQIQYIMTDTGDAKTVGKVSKDELKNGLTIDGIELSPVQGGATEAEATPLPSATAGQNRKMDASPGWYSVGGVPVEATSGHVWKWFWNGTTWSLVDMGELPKDEPTGIIASGDTRAISGDTSYNQDVKNTGSLNIPFDSESELFGFRYDESDLSADDEFKPTLSIIGENLNAKFLTVGGSIGGFFTGVNLADSIADYIEAKYKIDSVSGSPFYGLMIGNPSEKEWVFLVYGVNGGVYSINSNGLTSTLRSPSSEYSYGTSDEVSVTIFQGGFRTSKNRIYSDYLSAPSKYGRVYFGARNGNGSAGNNVMVSDISVHRGSGNDLYLSTNLATVKRSINNLPFSTADLAVPVSGTSGAVSGTTVEGGLKIVAGSLGSGGETFISGIKIDNTKSIYTIEYSFIPEVLSSGNPIIGLVFGNDENYTGIGYRSDGSISVRTPSGFTNVRGASSQYAYADNDKIRIVLSINKTAGTITVQSEKNADLDSTKYSVQNINWQAVRLWVRSTAEFVVSNIFQSFIEVDVPVIQENIFYVSSTGNDNNNGSKNSPLRQINTALAKCIGKLNSKIIVGSGTYSTINASLVGFEKILIESEDKKVVQVRGSDSITGWSLSSGFDNTYQASFSGNILSGSRMPRTIFEHGRISDAILPEDRHAIHGGLTHRIPFTPMVVRNSIQEVEENPNSFYHDTTIGIVYVHTIDSSNPSENGYSYEVIARAGFTSPGYNSMNRGSITLKNIQFLYTTSVRFRGLETVVRRNCSSFACLGAGAFQDDSPFVDAFGDIAAYCDGDGGNGHMTVVPDYINLDQLEGVQRGIYRSCWYMRNFDDGFSFHERSNVVIHDSLIEYNGDGGLRQSNDAVIRAYNVVSRKNGWDIGVGTNGSGFDMVNAPSENRLPGVLELYNCISEENRNGIGIVNGGGILRAYSSISRNNQDSEYFAADGVVYAENCRATNSDEGKKKVVSENGIINVVNDDILV